jgi:hypothetical protein
VGPGAQGALDRAASQLSILQNTGPAGQRAVLSLLHGEKL